jgi:hypothetical protein
VKPDTGSAFHGVELTTARASSRCPLAFVRAKGAQHYKLASGKGARGRARLARMHSLTGKMKTVEGVKYFRTRRTSGSTSRTSASPSRPRNGRRTPRRARSGSRSRSANQTLVLWEGKKPVYATLVSTGRRA